jgi:hypothetical protein
MDPTQCMTASRDDRRLTGMAAGMFFLTFLSPLASANPTVAPDAKAQVQANYGKLPLSFEANQGQTDARVKFLARGQGYTLFLTPTETVLSLNKPQAKTKTSSSSIKPSPAAETIGTVLRMQLVGANSAAKMVGREPLPGKINYLIGKNSSRWHTQVPTYGKVAYEGIYPGVDLVYYGNQGQLEYDFAVAAGADPHNIKLSFRGADKIDVNPTGELILHTKTGDLHMHKPVIYQQINGVHKPVNGGYVLKKDQSVCFQVAAYDPTLPLVIDPVLIYSTYLGGSDLDTSSSIAVDLQGRIYVAGTTSSSDFPVINSVQPTLSRRAGGFPVDAFVAQLTADGSALRYATYLGGSEDDISRGVVVDLRGQATVTGYTTSPDFPTHNALQPTRGVGSYAPGASRDTFVTQLTADGSALRYSTYLGGSEEDVVGGIAVDRRGQVVLAGFTRSTNFPTKNALQPNFGGGFNDGFVTQLTANGALRYSTYLGGSYDDGCLDIAVDLQGRAYVTGATSSLNFPTKNALQPALKLNPSRAEPSGDDAFVVQLTANGSALRYSTYLGGSEADVGFGIAVDLRGQAYVTGLTRSTDFPTVRPVQPTFRGGNDDVTGNDAFIAKLSANGKALRYSTYLGGSGNDIGFSIAVDLRGQAVATGSTDSPNFPTKNALQSTFGGSYGDAFVTQFTADGATLRYSTYLGGSGTDGGAGIAVDLQGQVYVTGSTDSPNFPIVNALQPAFGGNNDVFVAKIRNDGQR